MTRTLILAVLACAIITTPLAAQRQTPAGYKDPGTSTLLSVVIPGGGHLYSGETGKGAALLGVGLVGITLGMAATASSVGVSCDDDSFSCEDDTNYLPIALGYAAYLGSWIYGIMDADDSAERMNAQRGIARIVPNGLTPVVALTRDGGTQLGVGVSF